jgi:hypothetical protein
MFYKEAARNLCLLSRSQLKKHRSTPRKQVRFESSRVEEDYLIVDGKLWECLLVEALWMLLSSVPHPPGFAPLWTMSTDGVAAA